VRSIASLQRIGKYDSARRFSRAPRIWTFLNSLEAEFFNALLTPLTRLAVNCNVTRNCARLFCDNAHRRDFGFRRRLAVKLDGKMLFRRHIGEQHFADGFQVQSRGSRMRGDFRQKRSMSCTIFHCLKRSGFVTLSPRDPLEKIHDFEG
jgi:hypothetical protein